MSAKASQTDDEPDRIECVDCGREFIHPDDDESTVYMQQAPYDTRCPFCGLPHDGDGQPWWADHGVNIGDLYVRDMTGFNDGQHWHSVDHVIGPDGSVTLLVNDEQIEGFN